eukprot:CAMPEP_0178914902 /NCGR_PEP_ID=MMETSP0786-20121207/11702_1 /TAXON_ID=186022 /ORGANISM="Thalassionema frauenfeldii, Strain CCMP 1798" /LENGTH=33 /DNA_ID= /DNA_START= /DNA_END= /DNA_ORIENTATION=
MTGSPWAPLVTGEEVGAELEAELEAEKMYADPL